MSRWPLPCGARLSGAIEVRRGADCSRPHPSARCVLRLFGQTSRALTRSQAPRGAVGASDRAGSPREFVITWRTRRSRVPQRPQVCFDFVWRKLADGPTTGNLSGAGLASPPPLLDIAQVRYRPTSETVSRRGMAGLLWLLSRASIHRLGGQGNVMGRDWGGGDGAPDVSGAGLSLVPRACATGPKGQRKGGAIGMG